MTTSNTHTHTHTHTHTYIYIHICAHCSDHHNIRASPPRLEPSNHKAPHAIAPCQAAHKKKEEEEEEEEEEEADPSSCSCAGLLTETACVEP